MAKIDVSGGKHMDVDSTASLQWASRPKDERFLDLLSMRDKFDATRAASKEIVVGTHEIRAVATGDENFPDARRVGIVGPSGKVALPTHWAFGQMAQRADAPAGYLRSLDPALAADCINWGLGQRQIESVGALLQQGIAPGEDPSIRAITGPDYGRIWNNEAIHEIVNAFGDGVSGRFRVPGEFGKAVEITNANTTLYASDRDFFVFLADEQNKIEVPNRRNNKGALMSRGVYMWNSEVGAGTIGAAFFFMDHACYNRNIWEIEEFKRTRIRHTKGAPGRWLQEILPVLKQFADSSSGPVLAHIRAAAAKRVDDVKSFLAGRQFSQRMARTVMAAHESEEGRPMESLWDISNGITAHARTIEFQNERVALEIEAGRIMALAA